MIHRGSVFRFKQLLVGLAGICISSVSPIVLAETKLNFTQAPLTGISLNDIQAILDSNPEIDVSVTVNTTNPFAPGLDVISLDSSSADTACDLGLLTDLENFDEHSVFTDKRNYLSKHKDDCTVSFANYSLVIAYPLLSLVTIKPTAPADLFDIDRFPGVRAMPDSPIGTLEWALLSYGIPRNELYQLLSTERGLNLAFARLDKIRKHTIWWNDVEELKELLNNKQVVMAVGPHTAFYEIQYSTPMEIIWRGQLMVDMKMGINASSTNKTQAREFIQEVMSDAMQFELAYQFGFGPASKGTLKRLSLLPQSSQLMPFIPSHKPNLEHAIWLDNNWHQHLAHKISHRFEKWRAGSDEN